MQMAFPSEDEIFIYFRGSLGSARLSASSEPSFHYEPLVVFHILYFEAGPVTASCTSAHPPAVPVPTVACFIAGSARSV